MGKSLFDKYGGFSVVSRMVLALYERLLDDDDIGPFFDDVDLPKIVDHQTKFVSSLMGGPASFSDDHLARAHSQLLVSDSHFDQLKSLVAETLADFDMHEQDIETVLGEFEARRALIVKPADVD